MQLAFIDENGAYIPVIGSKDYKTVAEWRKDMRVNADFAKNTDYTLIPKKPVLRIRAEERIKIEEV